jgi:hypothetical protein
VEPPPLPFAVASPFDAKIPPPHVLSPFNWKHWRLPCPDPCPTPAPLSLPSAHNSTGSAPARGRHRHNSRGSDLEWANLRASCVPRSSPPFHPAWVRSCSARVPGPRSTGGSLAVGSGGCRRGRANPVEHFSCVQPGSRLARNERPAG